MKKTREIKNMINDLLQDMKEIQSQGNMTYIKKREYKAQIHALKWVIEEEEM